MSYTHFALLLRKRANEKYLPLPIMSFADREQRLRQYFIETGLQEWGDTTHTPNEL